MTSTATTHYPAITLYLDGQFQPGTGRGNTRVINPATEAVVTEYANAGPADIAQALASAERGYARWRNSSPAERAGVLRTAAQWLRAHIDELAGRITLEMGKVVEQAKMEVAMSAETFEWYAEEVRRVYGRTIAPRNPQVFQWVAKDPVGIVAGFSPWNFPMNQAAKKIAPAIAAGCAIICKGPEEAPSSLLAIGRALHEAGLPPGVCNLLLGIPSEISAALLASPSVRKVSFTGSVPVGIQLAKAAAEDLKRGTFELGGHAPVIVCHDVDIAATAALLVETKIRNAGQTCISPTRFLIDRRIYAELRDAMVEKLSQVEIGDSLTGRVDMGPVANLRRLRAMEGMSGDARESGAKIVSGGERVGSKGYFWKPTLIEAPSINSRAMTEEPFGPMALLLPYEEEHEAITEANRLPFGLAAYVFSKSSPRARRLAQALDSGMVSINHFGLGLPETPFGGVKHSGYGLEGGLEGIEAYLQTRFISERYAE